MLLEYTGYSNQWSSSIVWHTNEDYYPHDKWAHLSFPRVCEPVAGCTPTWGVCSLVFSMCVRASCRLHPQEECHPFPVWPCCRLHGKADHTILLEDKYEGIRSVICHTVLGFGHVLCFILAFYTFLQVKSSKLKCLRELLAFMELNCLLLIHCLTYFC